MNTEIINAIERLNVIELIYDGELRIIEPHCYGITTAGNEGLRAYQIGGFSSKGIFGWKMYDLGKASNIRITEQHFNGARSGFKKGDKNMSLIFREI